MTQLRFRRRRDRGKPPSEPPVTYSDEESAEDFVLEAFTCVPVAEDQVLLRIEGEWRRTPAAAPVLATRGGGGRTAVHSSLPGPAPGKAGTRWQAGFAVSVFVAERSTQFLLGVGNVFIPLPAPADAVDGEGPRAAPSGPPEPPEIRDLRNAWEQDADRRLADVRRMREQLAWREGELREQSTALDELRATEARQRDELMKLGQEQTRLESELTAVLRALAEEQSAAARAPEERERLAAEVTELRTELRTVTADLDSARSAGAAAAGEQQALQEHLNDLSSAAAIAREERDQALGQASAAAEEAQRLRDELESAAGRHEMELDAQLGELEGAASAHRRAREAACRRARPPGRVAGGSRPDPLRVRGAPGAGQRLGDVRHEAHAGPVGRGIRARGGPPGRGSSRPGRRAPSS